MHEGFREGWQPQAHEFVYALSSVIILQLL